MNNFSKIVNTDSNPDICMQLPNKYAVLNVKTVKQ